LEAESGRRTKNPPDLSVGSVKIAKYEAGTLPFTLNCPICLLRMQADTMRKYLDILEIRGKIEKINLVD
jgi:hypothetical protein